MVLKIFQMVLTLSSHTGCRFITVDSFPQRISGLGDGESIDPYRPTPVLIFQKPDFRNIMANSSQNFW